MNLLSWLLFGLVLGIVANQLDDSHKNSLIGWIGVSTAGAIVGGLLGSTVLGISPFDQIFKIQTFVSSILISIMLLVGVEGAHIKTPRLFEQVGHRIYRQAFKKI